MVDLFEYECAGMEFDLQLWFQFVRLVKLGDQDC